MNFSMIFYLLGWVLCTIGSLMVLPLSASIYFGDDGWKYFLLCGGIMFMLGGALVAKKPKNTRFYAQEGLVMTALSWLLLSFTGALPFWVSGEIPSLTNALFETVSGFTTTGASILHEVESMSKSMMFWRCFTQWIGGMGVLVFLLALIPLTGGQDLYIMKAESPGPKVEKLVPTVRKTAYYLYAIYFALTLAEIISLKIAGMPLYDSVCVSFTTTSTGGFGVVSTSIGEYSSAVHYVMSVFLFLSGLNYNFFFLLYVRKFRDAFKMQEVRLYTLIFGGSIVVIMINLITNAGYSLEAGFRHAAFQVGSIMTTAGFSSVDFDAWPGLSKTVLVLLMFIGGCAGSTCGGIKVSRILLYYETFKKELQNLAHPRAVKVIQIDEKPVPHNVVRSSNIFLVSYLLIFVASLFVVSIDGFDFETNFTAVAASIGNIGPGLSLVGPSMNYDLYSGLSKFVLIFDMLAGRLELFPMLMLLVPATWKRK